MTGNFYADELTKRAIQEYVRRPDVPPMDKIKHYRVMLGLTKRDMGRLLECSAPTYSAMENTCLGSYPKPKYIVRFSQLIDVPIVEIWGNYYEA